MMMNLHHEQVRVVRAASGHPGQLRRRVCLRTTDPESHTDETD